MKYILYPVIVILLFVVLSSCSEDPDVLIKNGDYEKAIIILKEQLSKDYKNTLLRNKITLLYFTNAEQNISENDLDEAGRNIERGIIYSDETNPQIKDRYADILVQLGAKLIENGSREGGVDLKKKYEKGIKSIKKAYSLSESNEKAAAILNSIKEKDARAFYDSALEFYRKWLSDKRKSSYLDLSRRELERAGDIYMFSEIKELGEKLTKAFLTVNMKSRPFDFRILKIHYNYDSGFAAFRVRFYNNSDNDMVLSPVNFILYDYDGNRYIFDRETAIKRNYKGLLKKFRINPERFVTGLITFKTDENEEPVFEKLVWDDGSGNESQKYFPKKPLTEIELP